MEKQILKILSDYMSFSDLKEELNIKNERDEIKLSDSLLSLLEKEEIILVNDFYIKKTLKYKYVGVVRKRVGRNFAFVSVEGLTDDIFVPNTNLLGALNNDIVQVSISVEKTVESSAEGKVEKILKRSLITGEVYRNKKSKKILFYTSDFTADIVNGDKFIDFICSAEIVKVKYDRKIRRNVYTVKIVDKIISKYDKYSEIQPLIYQYGFSPSFSKDVLEDAKRIEQFTDIESRVSLVDKLVVTIDGSDAKDLDDAICLEKLDDKYLLTVSIADVSYYVREDSILDKEAYERATSVYLVDRVLPMLPKTLSDDLCSLNTKSTKATLSVSMLIDSEGSVIKSSIYSSYIKSKYRLDYETVNKFYDSTYSYKDTKLEKMLLDLKKLQVILNNKRQKRGTLDFETNELKIKLDNDMNVISVNKRERGLSERVIEECMLLTNEVVAKTLSDLKVPSIYRTHDTPDYEKLTNVIHLTHDLGVDFKGDLTNVIDLHDFVKQLNEKSFDYITNGLILRSMAKAVYSENNTGHYGLQSDYYTHFTSPIRRYPDLIVHRLIRMFVIDKDFSKTNINKYKEYLPKASSHTSNKEQLSVTLERDVEKIFLVKYMTKYINKIFNGKITSVTKFGFFVELENGIEGLVHFEDLNTYFEYYINYVKDEFGLTYTLGQVLDFKVFDVDLKEYKIRLLPVNKR